MTKFRALVKRLQSVVASPIGVQRRRDALPTSPSDSADTVPRTLVHALVEFVDMPHVLLNRDIHGLILRRAAIAGWTNVEADTPTPDEKSECPSLKWGVVWWVRGDAPLPRDASDRDLTIAVGSAIGAMLVHSVATRIPDIDPAFDAFRASREEVEWLRDRLDLLGAEQRRARDLGR